MITRIWIKLGGGFSINPPSLCIHIYILAIMDDAWPPHAVDYPNCVTVTCLASVVNYSAAQLNHFKLKHNRHAKLRNGSQQHNNIYAYIILGMCSYKCHRVIDIDNTCVREDKSIKFLVVLGLLVCSCTFLHNIAKFICLHETVILFRSWGSDQYNIIFIAEFITHCCSLSSLHHVHVFSS